MEVIKSGGNTQNFSIDKIIRAITLANNVVEENERMSEADIAKVVQNVEKRLEGFNSVSTDDIHDMVESALMKYVKYQPIAKAYIAKRIEKKNRKKYNEIEEQALSLRDGTSILRGDNANKHIDDNASLRDYLAGLVCKSLANKTLPKEIITAHKKGLIHWHDADYSPGQPLHNCDLINVDDMMQNKFQMGDTLIEPNEDTPFETACNLLAQINLQVSGRQYGGQTVSWSHLLPFIANSRRMIREEIEEDINELPLFVRKIVRRWLTDKRISKRVEKKLRKEIYKGVKTYQYQVLCHSSSNGQTPFVSNNLCLREAQTKQELDDFAVLIEEIFKRRMKGVKNSEGYYVSPLFPKLLYWTCDGLNVKENDPYFYLTELAAKCELKRCQPDIVSEKETRRVKQGQIIPSMGCRSLLAPIWEEHTYPIDTEFYWSKKFGKRCEYPYDIFLTKESFKKLKNGVYKTGYEDGQIAVNFRGNTGWLKEKTDTTVTILEPKVYGRWNNGVVTINLPHVALEARDNYGTEMSCSCKNDGTSYTIMDEFYKILDERLELCHKALKLRYQYASEIKSINSEILWRHGALARLGKDETVGDLMKKYPQRASISVGYVGLFETCYALIGESNTTENGIKVSKEILEHMNKKCNEWKENDNINYSIYGTPEETLTAKFATANRKDFGVIPYITDKDYVVNSYHVDPREKIDAFSKLRIEGEYLALSSGGAVSYVEIPDNVDNPLAIVRTIQYMHEHIVYAEFNKKMSICFNCGHEGGIDLIKTEDGKFKFRCPICGNEDDNKLDVTGRLCGYLGRINAANTNTGRLDDIYNRVIHFDNFDEIDVFVKDLEGEIK